MPEKHTLGWHFPLLTWCVQRTGYLIYCMAIAMIAFFAVNQPVIALACAAIAVGFGSLAIDTEGGRKWPVWPNIWFAAVCVLTGGLGPILLVISEDVVQGGILEMQKGIVLGHLAFFIAYRSFRPSFAKAPSLYSLSRNSPGLSGSLVGACVFCMIWAVADTATGAFSGYSDRGIAGEDAANKVFGYWSYFLAFNRLNGVAFLLLPYVLGVSSVVFRLGLIACSIYVIGMAFLSGARNAAFLPFVMMGVGYVGLLKRPRFRLEMVAIVLSPMAILLFVFLDHFRNTETFKQEALANPFKRAEAILEVRSRAENLGGAGAEIIGSRVIGVVDPIIYEATPSIIPYAHTESVEAIIWLYVPYFFFPDRPIMLDGPMLGERYLNSPNYRTSIGPSLVGDWYRRFGWAGVILGMAGSGLTVALLVRTLVWLLTKDPKLGVAFILVITVFVGKDSNMTVLTGLWVILYDIPKHVLMLYSIMKVAALFASKGAVGESV